MTVYVVALAAEARPLIDALKLKRAVDKPWPTYSNNNDYLLLSGVGQLNAAAACGWLVGHAPHLARVPWLNVGIAGHATHALGDIYWVERLLEKTSNHYPALHCANTLKGAVLQTVDKPCSNYPDDTLVDMEGLAFYITCSRFVPLELVHLVKVVSDNREHPLEVLQKDAVQALIKNKVDEILTFSTALNGLTQRLPEASATGTEELVSDYKNHWRFSHNQEQQLYKLLGRYHALTKKLWLAHDFESPPRDAKQVLLQLEAEITKLPVVMS